MPTFVLIGYHAGIEFYGIENSFNCQNWICNLQKIPICK